MVRHLRGVVVALIEHLLMHLWLLVEFFCSIHLVSKEKHFSELKLFTFVGQIDLEGFLGRSIHLSKFTEVSQKTKNNNIEVMPFVHN